MGDYTKNSLQELEHLTPKQHFYGPAPYIQPNYKQTVQYIQHDITPLLLLPLIKFIQCTTSNFFSRAIDNTMLHALNNIATATVNGTEATLKATEYFLNYVASNPNASIRFCASNMILQVHSDAAYLVALNTCNCARDYHFLGTNDQTQFNAPILVLAHIIKNVIASVAEAEIGSLYMNAREAIPLRICVIDLGHK